jgi:hypothetical protein
MVADSAALVLANHERLKQRMDALEYGTDRMAQRGQPRRVRCARLRQLHSGAGSESGDSAERRQTVPIPSHEPDHRPCALKIDDHCLHQPLGVCARAALRARSRPLFPRSGGTSPP